MAFYSHRRDTAGTLTGFHMPRHARAYGLEKRTTRLELPIAKKPIFVKVGPGVGLGYRRNQTAGTWVARIADGKGKNWTKAIALADDFDDADDGKILNFWQAQERARVLAYGSRGSDSDDGKLVTVAQALHGYELDLKTRSGDVSNVRRIRLYLSDDLAAKTVALLAARDLGSWRNRLLRAGLTPSSVNRSCNAFKAALNLAASLDERIRNQRAWGKALASIPDADSEPRNVILSERDLLKIVNAAYTVGQEFGLLAEVMAVTGARPSQLGRLEVQDLQGDRANPRLMMPSSRKGRGKKKITRRPVPVPADLALRLRLAAGGRNQHAPLLLKPSGQPWKRSDHTRLFRRAVKCADLDPNEVTIYALRHSNIVRQLLAHVPTRVVAINHDTSVAIIEKSYSRYISDHSDKVTREALLNTARPTPDNVVLLPREPRA
jgi:integrase